MTAEVDALYGAIVGERDGDDAMAWLTHLGARAALAEALVARIADERAIAVAEMVESSSVRQVAAVLGMSHQRVQQLTSRARS